MVMTSFQSRPTLKLLLFGVAALIPSLHLVRQAVYYSRVAPRNPEVAGLFLIVGVPCLALATIFFAKAFSGNRITAFPSYVEIRHGTVVHKIPWDRIRNLSVSTRMGFKALYLMGDRRSFWFLQPDFPNFSKLVETLEQGRAGRLFGKKEPGSA